MENKFQLQKNKGFVAFFISILVLIVMLGVVASLAVLTVNQEKIYGNTVRTTQSYFASEAGIEDALLRLVKNKKWSSPYNLSVGSNTSTVEISNIIGGSRTITSTGNALNRIRKIQVAYAINSDQISFHYGAQIGDGGMIMGNNSQVQGNVFSNGSVTGWTGSTISNSIIVARNGNRIEGITVGENATVHTCKDSTIGGTLTYVSGGSINNCPAGETAPAQPNEILPEDLPISQSQIADWKVGATAGGIITSDVTITGIQSRGPVQIGTVAAPKNLTVENGATFRVTGTIYVTGDIIFNNLSNIRLDNSYESLSGVIVADGTITVNPNVILSGSGEAGSYILILSTKNDTINPVISVMNNASGAIFFSNFGLILLKNNMTAREITGYKVQLENNAIIQYESGLENSNFCNGPGGSWQVESWKEIE